MTRPTWHLTYVRAADLRVGDHLRLGSPGTVVIQRIEPWFDQDPVSQVNDGGGVKVWYGDSDYSWVCWLPDALVEVLEPTMVLP